MPYDPSVGNLRGSRILGCEPEDVIFARRCQECGEYDCECPPIYEMGLDPRALGLAYITFAGRIRLATGRAAA